MEGRRLRERRQVTYDEKAIEAEQYEDAFEFMDTDHDTQDGKAGRCACRH